MPQFSRKSRTQITSIRGLSATQLEQDVLWIWRRVEGPNFRVTIHNLALLMGLIHRWHIVGLERHLAAPAPAQWIGQLIPRDYELLWRSGRRRWHSDPAKQGICWSDRGSRPVARPCRVLRAAKLPARCSDNFCTPRRVASSQFPTVAVG